jgi:hypothetical protein
MIPSRDSLLGRIFQAALVILLVAIATNVGWRLIKPFVPAVVVLVALGLLFRFLLRR